VESQKLERRKLARGVHEGAKTADGSLGAVSILCPVLIRGKMLGNTDMMNNNIPGKCRVLQKHRSLRSPKANGLLSGEKVARTDRLDCLKKYGLASGLGLYSRFVYTPNSTSSSTVDSIGSPSKWPSTTRNGQATIGHHAGGKCSHNLGICLRATPCTRIDSALGLCCSSSSVHLSGRRDDMAIGVQRRQTKQGVEKVAMFESDQRSLIFPKLPGC
jgi:hypothetical protein